MNIRFESLVASWIVTALVFGVTTIRISDSVLAAPNEGLEKHKQEIEKFENGFAAGARFKGDPAVTIQQRMEHYGVPGMCVAVVKDNKVIWTKGYGVMDRQTNQPVTADTLFQCASISKPVSAAAALRMVELGKLDLKSDVNKFLKSWKLPENEFTKQKPATLKHIVSHTGGLTVHGFLGYTKDQQVPSLTQLLDGKSPSNSGQVRVDKLPGGAIRYSGGGYCVMQQMMLDAYDGKMTFPKIMDQLVLDRLGMQRSTFEQPLPLERQSEAATGYLPNGQVVDGKQHTYPEMAPAGLYSTASELAKFFIEIQLANQGDDMRLLSHRMAKRMLREVDARFGLGIGVKDHGGELYMGHGGWNEGFSSEATFHQSRGYGVVILTNSNHPPFVEEAMRSVARAYNWDNFVLPEFEELPVTKAQIEVLAGRYDHDGNLLKISGNEKGLVMESGGRPPIQLQRVDGNCFTSREMNDLICFSVNGLSFKKPWENKVHPSNQARRLDPDEKLPVEWLMEGNFEKALAGYKDLKKATPDSAVVNEERLNAFGYELLNSGQKEQALNIFRINTILYPEAFNTFDSLGEIYLQMGKQELGIQNYRKSLKLNPDNANAKEVLQKLKATSKT